MPTVELVEDPSVRASCSPLKPLQQEVTKAYFATRENKESVVEGEGSGETKVIDHTTTAGQTLSKIAAQYKVELKDVKRTKTTKYLQIGEIVKVTTKEETSEEKTTEVKFNKVTSATVNSDLYIVVETKHLQGEKALINVLQGQEDALAKKDTALTVQQDDADVVKIEAVVGDFGKDEDITNKDDFKDWAITKVKLAPKDEDKLQEWIDGLECLESKKTALYLLVDVHSENSLCDFKSEYVDYKGYKGATDDNRIPNHFLNEEGEWLEVQNGGICGGKGCIKDGDENKLVQELNIRLAGFGGNVPTEKFTERTVDMIKQFQKDYMEIEPTGTVCGDTLAAIDEFETKYPIVFSELKCDCNVCTGFGQGKYATQKQSAAIAEKSRKYEYPGIHRSLLWAYKAMMFYMTKKEGGKYTINKISSGYRCHEDNKIHGRSSTNHMGKAIDIHFNKNGTRTREITDVEAIRDKIIIPTNKAQINWGSKDKFSLEPSRNASYVATTWIHMDVRQFDLKYLKDEFFANTEAKIKGKKIVDVAKDEGFASAVDCQGGGFTSQDGSASNADDSGDRVDPKTLSFSNKGVDFLKGWESEVKENGKHILYDDDSDYCTIGYGHLVAGKKSCASITNMPQNFKNGLTDQEAKDLFKADLKIYEDLIKNNVTVDLYQYEFDALVSFSFNVGGPNFRSSTMLKKLNASKYDEVPAEFPRWNKSGGVVMAGLTKRRNREADIFKDNKYDSTH